MIFILFGLICKTDALLSVKLLLLLLNLLLQDKSGGGDANCTSGGDIGGVSS